MLGTESFDEIVLNISTKVLNCSSINTDKSRITMAMGHSGGLRKSLFVPMDPKNCVSPSKI